MSAPHPEVPIKSFIYIVLHKQEASLGTGSMPVRRRKEDRRENVFSWQALVFPDMRRAK
jgi:hypothetical protein